ncbi:MAG: polyprenol monophosphomannose synthase [Candidatus Curtissbacteria bacterium]|nr:polyprenol monophosphomannose synthase [Candidatus Curtissbacteria bacterium]
MKTPPGPIAIVIPTYNEALNIKNLISAVRKEVKRNDKIIIVDDSTGDNTAQIVKKIAKSDKNVFAIERKIKKGRGSAIFEGFRFAQKFKPAYFIEMDADFSHDPQAIPELLAQIKKGSDVVIGSRYLAQSKILNWPLSRKIFSRFSNLYAKFLLGVPISDFTNGYRIYNAKSVKFLLGEDLRSTGYIMLSETAYKLKKAKFKFAEIPITFINRKRGKSNTNFSEIKNAFIGILRIRFTK